MKLISWNVNGIRACINKGFMDILEALDADIFSIQESKAQPEQICIDNDKYYQYINSAQKKGYSGTICLSKQEPINFSNGVNIEKFDDEGRVITLEYKSFYLVNVYTPNAQNELKRIDYRCEWDEMFLNYIKTLDNKKPVIVCGDLNVAHKPIDLKNPKSNEGNAGYSIQEREGFQKYLDNGFVDSFRYLHPNVKDVYSWWSYRFNARKNNAGWRIDYFLVSNKIKDKILKAEILTDIQGSDHCPILLEVDINE